MPAFKADYAEYNPQISAEDNLLELFQKHNELIQRVSRTVNNLDDENFAVKPTTTQQGDEEDE